MVDMKVTVPVEIYLGEVASENLFCSGVYSSEDCGQTVEIDERTIGPKGREAIMSEYEVNVAVEAALSENDVDYASDRVVMLITEYSAADMADGSISIEDAAYSAKLIE